MNLVALPVDSRLTLGSRTLFSGKASFASAASSPMMFDGDFSSLEQQSYAVSPRSPGSMTSSPVPSSYASEQRESKSQRDRARRDSRPSARMRRYSNTSYGEEPSLGSIDPLNGLGMPGYPSATTTMSMLAEPSASLAPSSYMSQYSPAMSEQSLPGQSYHLSYQQPLPQSYNIPLDYHGYLDTGAFGTPRHDPAAAAHNQDTNFVYQMPSPVMPARPSQEQDGVPTQSGGNNVRLVQGRPKPRCWEHGCNGRQFSTFSNLLRHQREKSGQAAKSTCPNCGAEFTRTTARNGHMLHEKCKRRSTTSSS